MNPILITALSLVLAAPSQAGATKGRAPLAGGDEPAAPVVRNDASTYGFIPRVPFQTGKVFRVVLVPGAPFTIELPLGEQVLRADTDRQWFNADSEEGTNRILVWAIAAEGVESKRSFLSVQSKSGMLYTFALEVGSMGVQPAPGLRIYIEGADAEQAIRRAANVQAQAQAGAYQGELERRMRAEFNRWKAETLASYKAAYRVDEDGLKVSKVLSNSVQTFVFAPGLTEVPTVKLVNKDKQEEALDFEHDNGVYTINRVLRYGERLVLQAGKAKATVRVD